MPEDAPVMSTTFPAIHSLNIDLFTKYRSLKVRYGGKMKMSVMKDTGGSIMFNNLCVRSMVAE